MPVRLGPLIPFAPLGERNWDNQYSGFGGNRRSLGSRGLATYEPIL